MITSWFRSRRRREILTRPFPPEWEAHIQRNMAHWSRLGDAERHSLREMVQIFAAEKNWEGCGGQEINDENRATIAAQACLLLLGLEHDYYKNVHSILLYPSTVVTPERGGGGWGASPTVSAGPMPILGEAMLGGPVLLVWDSVRRGGIQPEKGHNVVYHEFAHKLDMLDGAVDGTPLMATRDEYRGWVSVCTREYEALKRQRDAGRSSLLDNYGATNAGEFFAVITETFFDRALELKQSHPELYSVMQAFYRQDPAQRE